jgi:hypothetical protein
LLNGAWLDRALSNRALSYGVPLNRPSPIAQRLAQWKVARPLTGVGPRSLNRTVAAQTTRHYAAPQDQFAWKLPALSMRSKVCAPKKSRCACTRLAGRRSER